MATQVQPKMTYVLYDDGTVKIRPLADRIYELYVGSIPPNYKVAHKNMNIMDCRPANLYLVRVR